jgi:acyl-CoA thioester hydrolase
MYINKTQIRVRYSETDKMGYCYYGNYAAYFEVARVESLRALDISYKELEDEGLLLPVLDFSIKYYIPAYYDDLLTIECSITELPSSRIKFTYKTYNEKKENINFAITTLAFINKKTRKPTRCPEKLINKLIKYIK